MGRHDGGRRGPYDKRRLTWSGHTLAVQPPKTFGAHLKVWRRENGKTQDDVAQLVGVARAQVAQWETGKRQPLYETRRRFAVVIPEAAKWPSW